MYGNREWRVTTEPAIEPITVAEVKDFARIDGSYEDVLFLTFIKAVRRATENYLGRALIEQTVTMSMNDFSDHCRGDLLPLYKYIGSGDVVVELPQPRLISVTEVRTLDESGTSTIYSSDNYYIRTIAVPGQLVLKSGVSPPFNTNRYFGGYEIEFKAGYGDSADDVPEDIKLGMIMWVSNIYEDRTAFATIPEPVKMIFNTERILPI